MAYKFVLAAVFMVLVSMAIAHPQAAPEDAKKSAAPKDFMAGMFFHSADILQSKVPYRTIVGGSSVIHILHVSIIVL